MQLKLLKAFTNNLLIVFIRLYLFKYFFIAFYFLISIE